MAELTDRQPPSQQQPGRSASSQVQSSNSKCRRPSNSSSSGTEDATEPRAPRRRRHNNDERANGCRSPTSFRRRKRSKESRQKHHHHVDRSSASSPVAVSKVSKPKRHLAKRKRVENEDVDNGRTDSSSSSSDSWTSATKSANTSQNSDSPTTTQRKLAPLKERLSKKKRLTADTISDLLNILKNNNNSQQKTRRKKKNARRRRHYDVCDDSVSESGTDNNADSSDSSDSGGDSDDNVEEIRFSQPEKWMKYFVNMYEAKRRQRISDKKRQTTTTTAVATTAAPTDKSEGNQDRVNSLIESVVATLGGTSAASAPSSTAGQFKQAADSNDKRQGLLPTPQPPTVVRGPFDELHFSSINRCAPPPPQPQPLPSLLDLDIACPWQQPQPVPQAPFLHSFTAAPSTGGQMPIPPQLPQQPQPGVFWPPWPQGGGDASNFLGDGLLPLPTMPPVPGLWTPGFMHDFFDGRDSYNDVRETERRHRRRSGGGEDDLFREERRPVEAWLCRMCDATVHEPYQTHRYSEDHKKKDKTARRGCQLCKTGAFSNYPDYLKHMDGNEHAMKKAELDNKVQQRKRRTQEKAGSPSKSPLTSRSPDTSTRSSLKPRSRKVMDDTIVKETSAISLDNVVVVDCADLDASCGGSIKGKPVASAAQLSATDTSVNEETADDAESTVQVNGETDNVDVPNAVGTEFLVPTSGFFCQLCRKFWPKERPARQHCSTDAHCQNYERYLAQQQSDPTSVEIQPQTAELCQTPQDLQ